MSFMEYLQLEAEVKDLSERLAACRAAKIREFYPSVEAKAHQIRELEAEIQRVNGFFLGVSEGPYRLDLLSLPPLEQCGRHTLSARLLRS